MRLQRVFRRPMARIGLIVAAVCIIAAAVPQKPSRRPAAEGHPAKRIVPAGIASFADVTRAAGIDFHLTCGSLEKRYIMETMCGGIAVFDYDNDGWMDIFLVNGSTLEDLRAGKCHPSKLYRNNHDGTFTDVTVKAGLSRCGWGFGGAGGGLKKKGGGKPLCPLFSKKGVLHKNKQWDFIPFAPQRGRKKCRSRWGNRALWGFEH